MVCVLLAFASPDNFHSAFNREASTLFGVSGDAYQKTLDAGNKALGTTVNFSSFAFVPTLLLMPWLAFSQLPEEDLSAIYAYLRTMQPIRNAVETHPGGPLKAVASR